MKIETIQNDGEKIGEEVLSGAKEVNYTVAAAAASKEMITLEQVKAENFLIALKEIVGDVDVLKETTSQQIEILRENGDEQQRRINSLLGGIDFFQNDVLKKLSSVVKSLEVLEKSLGERADYDKYLEEHMENKILSQQYASLSSEVTLLEKQLQKEKVETYAFMEDVRNALKDHFSDIGETIKNLKAADEIIKESIDKFCKTSQNEKDKLAEAAEEVIDELGEKWQSLTDGQIQGVKSSYDASFRRYAEKCQETLEIVKKQSIDFLKQCDAENKKLIEKIPVMKDSKYSKKDITVYALAFMSLISLTLQLFIR